MADLLIGVQLVLGALPEAPGSAYGELDVFNTDTIPISFMPALQSDHFHLTITFEGDTVTGAVPAGFRQAQKSSTGVIVTLTEQYTGHVTYTATCPPRRSG